MVTGRSQPVVQAINPRLVTITHVGLREAVHTLDAVEWLSRTGLGGWSVLGRLLETGHGLCPCSISADVSQHPVPTGDHSTVLGLKSSLRCTAPR